MNSYFRLIIDRRRTYLIVCIAQLIGTLNMFASDDIITVLKNKGEKNVFELSLRPKIIFGSENISIVVKSESINIPLAQVHKITFDNKISNSTSQLPLLSKVHYQINDNQLSISNLTPNSCVSITSITGIMLTKGMTDNSGYITLKISDTEAKVYIVKNQTLIFKIVNR